LNRVVTPLAAGITNVATYPVPIVPYLVFELADGDIRRHLAATASVDLAWQLRCLHDVATGLKQLHGSGIAHQDLKPSNVMSFGGGAESRVGDLGRAARQGVPAPHDNFNIAGDRTYAPPELLYKHVEPDWARRRLGCDLYHLGSLFLFIFSQTNCTHSLVAALDPALHPGAWKGRYVDVLPHVRDAFNRVLTGFRVSISAVMPKAASEVVEMVRQLCEPDPQLRGDPVGRGSTAQFSLERYISRLNALEYRARLGRA
jgi:serine/threonine protein kinase